MIAMCPLDEITTTEWKPISPPLTFPSSHFLASLQSQDSNVGDHDKSLFDQQPLMLILTDSHMMSHPSLIQLMIKLNMDNYTNIMNYEETDTIL